MCIIRRVVPNFVACYTKKCKGKRWKKGGFMMELLSDDLLIDTYFAAIAYKLEPDFIRMLAIEVKRRGVDIAAHANRRQPA